MDLGFFNMKDTLQNKLLVVPVGSLLVILLLSGVFITNRVNSALVRNENTHITHMAHMFMQSFERKVHLSTNNMKMTVTQQALYDGYFGAITEDFEFLKEFLTQVKSLTNVDDILLVQDTGEVLFRLASDERGDIVPFKDFLEKITNHDPITDKLTQLDSVIKTQLYQNGETIQFLVAGPILDIETIMGTIVFVTNLDDQYLGKEKEVNFEKEVELSIGLQDKILASTLPKWNYSKKLNAEKNDFLLKVNKTPYHHIFLPLKGQNIFIGISYDISSNKKARLIIILILAVIFIAATVILVTIIMTSVKKIIASIDVLQGQAEKISQGDLTADIEQLGEDEIGQVAVKFEKMNLALSKIVGKIKDVSEDASKQAHSLLGTTETLVGGADKLTQGTQEAVDSIREMAQTIQDVSENAAKASHTSQSSSDLANSGRETVSRTVDGMLRITDTVGELAKIVEGLGESSNEIVKIVGVIKEIADQTNLLALNATIEAARAGEHGRGFAVVADEVRTLAVRTTEATKEISEMIQKNQSDTKLSMKRMEEGKAEVAAGVKLAETAQLAMDSIVESSDNSTDMISRIAAATEEQSAAVHDVTSSIERVAETTTTTDVVNKKIKDAANDLTKLSDDLKKAVGWFTTKD